jgi:hypothetical protein
VTSTGEYLTVNSHSHPDLYWALRGGGGGTYGIVTSVTYRTHPSVPLTGVFFTANSTNNATISKLLAEFLRIQPDYSDAGFGGYVAMSPIDLQWVYIVLNTSQEQINQTVDPFFAFAQNLTSEGLDIGMAFTAPFDSFYPLYTKLFSVGEENGNITELATRLIPRDVVEQNYEGIADAILEAGGAEWLYVSYT